MADTMNKTESRNRVFAQFYGGSSYSFPELDDFEVLGSLKEAREAFASRVDWDPYFPCVDETAEMWIFFAQPAEQDGYPDRILSIGPRGGVREQRVA